MLWDRKKNMDVNKILEDLRREKEQLEEAIMSLERLAVGTKRRGRPPLWIAAAQQRATPTPAAVKAPPAGKSRKGKKRSNLGQNATEQ